MSLARSLAAFAALVAGLALSGVANAQSTGDWPSKPLKLVVPASAGGSSDAVGRILAEGLAKELGQPVVVDNIGGAASIAGTGYVARSDPDGYTLLISSASVVIVPLLEDDLPYVSARDLAPVSQITTSGHVLVVNPDVMSVTSVPQLVTLLKQKPGYYNFSSSGVGSTPHMMVELFMATSGTKLTHVPFKSSGESAEALLGGEVQMTIDTMQAVLPFVQAGKMRALAVATPTRLPELPDVPSLKEFYPDFPPADLWLGIFVRAGTPKPIIDKLSKAISDFVHSPDGVKGLATTGSRPVGSTPEEFAQRLKTDAATWAQVVKVNNIKGN